MPRIQFKQDSDDDEFETEAFNFMNEKKKDQQSDTQDSDDNLSGPEEIDDDVDLLEQADSDDDAPESVDFSDSRKSIMAQLKSAMKQVDQEKVKQKEKRKLKEVRFKEQKDKKIKYSQETRLPAEVLDNIDEVIPKDVKHRKWLEKQKRKEFPQQETEEVTEKTKPDQVIENKDEHSKFSEEYIPLMDDASGVEVAEIHHFEKQQKSLAQRAADFRNNRLYSKDSPRESNKSRLLKQEKKRQRLR